MTMPAPPGDVVLDVRQLGLRFGGVQALSELSFDVRAAELRGIIGPNGAGKSSVLNCINGVVAPQQGTISLHGERLTGLRPSEVARRGVARTFQNLAVFKGMSVLDNLMTGRHVHMRTGLLAQVLHLGPARREAIAQREQVERLIDFLELQAWRKTPVGRLPYGLQKRVDLGRALALQPRLLLLDEPMAGMNLEEKQDMCRFILELNDEFRTPIVLIEHDMGVVMDLCDRVLVLDQGRAIADGTPDAVRGHEAVVRAYLGTAT